MVYTYTAPESVVRLSARAACSGVIQLGGDLGRFVTFAGRRLEVEEDAAGGLELDRGVVTIKWSNSPVASSKRESVEVERLRE